MIQYIGWVGTFFGLLSFSLLSFGFIKKEHILFSLFVVFSSSSFLISSYNIDNYQGVAANIFFFISSILAVFGISLRMKHATEFILYLGSILVFVITSYFYIKAGTNGWIFQSMGWVPVFMAPMIFFLYTQHKINEFKYYLQNLIANIIFCIHLLYIENYPLAICQLVAGLLCIYGLIRLRINEEKLLT